MKKIIFFAALAGLGWFVYQKLQSMSTQEKINASAPVQYTNSLQRDVKRAEDAAHKADDVIKQTTRDINRAAATEPENQQ